MNTKRNLKSIAGILMITAILIGICVIDVAAAPGNDNFADAIAIGAFPYNDNTSTSSATIEAGDPWTCVGQLKSIWYSYTPSSNTKLHISAITDYRYSATFAIFSYENFVLTQINCLDSEHVNADVELNAGTTYYFELTAHYTGANEPYPPEPPSDLDGGNVTLTILEILPPHNDDFAHATMVTGIPYSNIVDTTEATIEPNEPSACGWNVQKTIWYSFTPAESGFYTAESDGGYYPQLAVYTEINLLDLQQLDCKSEYSVARSSLWLEADTVYYYQTFMNDGYWGWNVNFKIYPTPPIEANISYSPGDPSKRQSIYFYNNTWDPVGIGVQYCAWDFGDGSTASDYNSTHAYEAEGDYSVQLTVITYDGRTASTTQTIHVVDLSPTNDDFLNAKSITAIPYSDPVDITYATTEPGEPTACGWSSNTVWYSFTPTTSGYYTAETSGPPNPVLAVYEGSDLANLQTMTCVTADWWSYVHVHLKLEAGTTYYFQTFLNNMWPWWGWNISFSLNPTPPPQTSFSYWPGDPSKFDSTQFNNESWDPVEIGIETVFWDFGDGSSSKEWNPTHLFASDGEYTVQLNTTAFDGRASSTSQVVQVRTHDVGITRFVVPSSARAGQTKQINVSIKNLYYEETVQVDLYKSTANGYVWVGSLTQTMPVRPANRAQVFPFAYTFSREDAAQGKVTFKAAVTIINARDAYTPDNEMISLVTKVSQ